MKSLADWKTFFSGELDRITADLYSRGIEYRVPKKGDQAALLAAKAFLDSVSVEKGISAFAQTKRWPALSDECQYHLMHRLKLADQAMASWIEHGYIVTDPLNARFPQLTQLPNPECEEKFIRWMLIELWDALGEFYLREWVKDMLRHVPQNPRGDATV